MGRRFNLKHGKPVEEDIEVADEVEEEKELDMSEIAVARRQRDEATIERDLIHNDNYYQLLELGHWIKDVTVDEVTKGYKKAAVKYHPDKPKKGRS